MRFLDLDCLGRPRPWVGNLLVAAGAIAALASTVVHRDFQEQARLWAERREAARQQAEPSAVPAGAPAMPYALKAAAEVAGELRLPWPELLAALEEARTDEVALLALDVDGGRRLVRIEGEAKEREAIGVFVRRLGGAGLLKNVFLVEDRLRRDDVSPSYRFLISAEWIDPA